MDKPNVLIIQADQHRHDCLGCSGNPDVRTPNIDALADDGTLYENAFCPYPVCTPSRFSFLTGLYVHQHLGWSNHCTIPAGLPTFPKVMREAGYKTKAVGKMHLTPTYLDVGFDEMLLAEQHGVGRLDDDYHRYGVQLAGSASRNDVGRAQRGRKAGGMGRRRKSADGELHFTAPPVCAAGAAFLQT